MANRVWGSHTPVYTATICGIWGVCCVYMRFLGVGALLLRDEHCSPWRSHARNYDRQIQSVSHMQGSFSLMTVKMCAFRRKCGYICCALVRVPLLTIQHGMAHWMITVNSQTAVLFHIHECDTCDRWW